MTNPATSPPGASSGATAGVRPATPAELAPLVGGRLLGPGDVPLTHIDSIDRAGPGALTFIRSARFGKLWGTSGAAGAIVAKDVALADLIPGFDPQSPASPRPLIIVPDADLAMVACLTRFAPPPAPWAPGVHPHAFVDPSATIHAAAGVGPGCVVGPGAKVGAGARLIAQVYVGPGAEIGDRAVLHPMVAIMDRCVVGADSILHGGVIVGGDGFGYHPSPDGRGLVKLPHIGNVVIGRHVEIGAGSCIDRAKFGSTTIGDGTKIDNLVQVGHGCRVGRSCVLCGQVGLAGSSIVEDGVIIGGQSGVGESVTIGARAKLGGRSGATSDVPPGGMYMGMPAGPAGEWRRIYAGLRRMGRGGGSDDRAR